MLKARAGIDVSTTTVSERNESLSNHYSICYEKADIPRSLLLNLSLSFYPSLSAPSPFSLSASSPLISCSQTFELSSQQMPEWEKTTFRHALIRQSYQSISKEIRCTLESPRAMGLLLP